VAQEQSPIFRRVFSGFDGDLVSSFLDSVDVQEPQVCELLISMLNHSLVCEAICDSIDTFSRDTRLFIHDSSHLLFQFAYERILEDAKYSKVLIWVIRADPRLINDEVMSIMFGQVIEEAC
jgi:hypothetical protein